MSEEQDIKLARTHAENIEAAKKKIFEEHKCHKCVWAKNLRYKYHCPFQRCLK